jgi:uncharacterized protein
VTIKEMLLPPLKSGTDRDLNVEELLVGIVNALVDDRSQVQARSKARVSGRIFQVTVAASDVGKIIGRNVHTATSIRGLLSTMGVAAKTRYGLDIVTMR